MAEFNADILLNVVTTKVDQAINRLEGSFDRLTQKAQSVSSGVADTSGFKRARAEVDKLAKSLERFGSIGAAAGVVGIAETVNTFSRELQNAVIHIERFGQSWDVANAPLQAFGDLLRNLTAPVDSLTTAFTQLGATGQATAAGIALATTGLLAFGPQVEQAAKGIFGLGKDARKTFDAVTGLNESFNMTASAVKKLEQSISAAGLKQAISEATKEQQNLVASSDDFRKKTVEVLNLEEQLTAELREQQRVIGQIQNERLGAALQRTGLGDAVSGSGQRLLPAFQERGLQELNTGYAEALRLTQQRTAELTTAANVERTLTDETTRGVRFREKSAEAAQRLRDYTGNVLQSAQGIGRTYQASARVQMSWNVALGQMRDLSTQIGQTKQASKKIDESSLEITYAQIKAQEHLADVEKKRAAAAQKDNADRAKRLESIALGVGFPLLFGAGGGSVLGSLAGSFAGQGFGGQILGGAVGQVFDDLAARTAELGRALNPLTADIDLIIERVGLVGTETATYIKALEDADQSTEALAAATRELEAIIGRDGVTALQGFGDQTQEFSNQWQVAMTQMGAALSALLSGPLGAVIANLERANALRSAQSSNDPVLQDLLRQRNEAGRPGIFGGGFDNVQSQLEINDQIVQRTRELANERANVLKEIEKSNELDLTSLNLLEAQIALEKTNGDLTDAAVFALEEKVIRRQAEVDLQAAGNDQTKIETALLEEQLRIIQLKNRADAARAKADAASAKSAEAEQKRVAALQAQVNTAAALLAIDQQIAAAQVDGDTAKLKELEYTRALEASELKIAEIRARRAGEAQTQLQIQLEEYRLEQELLKIDTQRAVAQGQLYDSFDEAVRQKQLEVVLLQTEEGLAKELLKAEMLINNERAKGVPITEAQVKAYMDAVSAAYKLTAQLSFQEQLITDTINGVGQQFTSLFDTLIQGTNDWNQVLTSTLRSLSSLLLKAGLSALGGDDRKGFFSILSGNFGKRADGGPVSANRPYLVGEEGPEMFVPGKSGTIIPNGAGGEVNSVVNVTINSDGGTSTDASQANALGRLVESTVVGVIQRERRPGGILSR